jgi:lipoprotein-anchoring transpeptidase ErfK/SrfK
MKYRLALIALIALLVLPSCADRNPPSGIEVYQAYERSAIRPHDPAAVRVKVSTIRQRAYVLENDRLLLSMPVSVGTGETPTPSGHFRITAKDARRRSATDGFAVSGEKATKTQRRNLPRGSRFVGRPLPYWCGFGRGLGFHTGWIKHTPCTDGCIRMHENVAPEFFNLVQIGTPVDIAPTQPEDRQYANIPLPPDAGPLPDYPATFYLGDGYFERHR